MSVICRELSKTHMVAYTKGAPEKLHTLCVPETLPFDFNARLAEYTIKGYRVIAIGYKNMPHNFNWKNAQKCKRDVVCKMQQILNFFFAVIQLIIICFRLKRRFPAFA